MRQAAWALSHAERESRGRVSGTTQEPDLLCRSTTFLTWDGHGAGQRFLFDGIQAVWLIAENVVPFYGENGRMLRSVEVEAA